MQFKILSSFGVCVKDNGFSIDELVMLLDARPAAPLLTSIGCARPSSATMKSTSAYALFAARFHQCGSSPPNDAASSCATNCSASAPL